MVGVTAGRDGNSSVSRRDGTVVVVCMSRRDETVIFNGGDFIGGTGRYGTTAREFVGGTGWRDHFDGRFTVPSYPAVTAVTVPPKYRDKPCIY